MDAKDANGAKEDGLLSSLDGSVVAKKVEGGYRCRWYQFSTRKLLCVVLLCAFLSGIAKWNIDWHRGENRKLYSRLLRDATVDPDATRAFLESFDLDVRDVLSEEEIDAAVHIAHVKITQSSWAGLRREPVRGNFASGVCATNLIRGVHAGVTLNEIGDDISKDGILEKLKSHLRWVRENENPRMFAFAHTIEALEAATNEVQQWGDDGPTVR